MRCSACHALWIVLLWLSVPAVFADGLPVRTFDLQEKCVTEQALLDVFLVQPRQVARADLPQGSLRYEVTGQTMSPKPSLGFQQLQIVNAFYEQAFNYRSFDGQGTGVILLSNLALSSDGTNCNPMNAFFANLGPDNVNLVAVLLGHPESPYDLARDLEVIAHEFGHGVFRTAQGMELGPEERGINEGVSDMLGVTVRAWYESGQRLSETRVREDSFLIGKYYGELITRFYDAPESIHEGYMRNLLNPYPWDTADHYDLLAEARFQGEHAASGIVSLPFALLVKGGSHPRRQDIAVNVQGIGFEKAVTIIFYVMKQRLPFNTMPEFATAAIKAAERIYGRDSQPAISTRNAFAVTGLVAPHPTAQAPEPQRTDTEESTPASDAEPPPLAESVPDEVADLSPSPAPDTDSAPNEPRGLSGPVFLTGLAVLLAALMVTGQLLVQRRRRQLLAGTRARHAHQTQPAQQVAPAQVNIAGAPDALAVRLTVGTQSAPIRLTEAPLLLGRRAPQLPAAILKALQADEWIGREHCQIWYRADSRQVYVKCLSHNGVTLNQQRIDVGEKARVVAQGEIHLHLGHTSLVIHCQPAGA